MPEPDRDPQHRPGRVLELDALPLAERRRAAAQVDDDVEHAPAGDPDELALPGMRLEVDAAQRALARARVVVLDELGRDAVFARDIGAERLHEEAAFVAVNGRREQDEAVESGLEALHCGRRLGSAPSKDPRAMPRTATMPPAARGHQTLSTYISARFDEFSRSQKDVAQYVVDHLDEVAFHTAEELARRANTSSARRSCASARRSASRASRSCRRRRARSTATTTARAQGARETCHAALQPRPVAVRAGRRRRSRQRRGHGAAGQPLRGRRARSRRSPPPSGS